MIVDYVDNHELQDAKQHSNELLCLDRLWVGLAHLDHWLQGIEAEARKRLNAETHIVYSWGNDPRLEGIP